MPLFYPLMAQSLFMLHGLAENDALSGALRGGVRGALIGGGIGAVVGILGYLFKKKK